MALSDGGNQGEGRTEEGGVPVVQDNAGQPGVRPTQRKGGVGMELSAQGEQASGDAARNGSGAEGSGSHGARRAPDPVQCGTRGHPYRHPTPRTR